MLRAWNLFVLAMLVTSLSSCGNESAPVAEDPASVEAAAAPATTAELADPGMTPVSQDNGAVMPEPVTPITSISLGSSPAKPVSPAAPGDTAMATKDDGKAKRDELLEAMMPLQVMLGQWRGTTQKEVGDFKALDEPQWVWDFQSDRSQPAMVMESDASPYFREIRLTYLTEEDRFRMTTVDPRGETRAFEGDFTSPVEEFQGDDRKLHRRYKLTLTELDPQNPRDQWQVVFNQQENHRYLIELAKKRGAQFRRFDTVANQREGTSFAANDEDYGEKKCIISGGLGTMQVSYQGKSYWVCCTGCKAAFEEDPESWIAELEEKARMQDSGS